MLVVHKWDGNSPFEMCNLAWNISFGSWLANSISSEHLCRIPEKNFIISAEKAELIWSFQIPDNMKNDL